MIQRDNRGRLYTESLEEANAFRVEDIRPTRFIKDERVRKRLESQQRYIKLYTKKGDRYYLPRSAYQIINNLPKDLDTSGIPFDLHAFQGEACKIMLNSTYKGGLVRAGTGSGKTIIMQVLAQSSRRKVVIVVPNKTIQKGVVKSFKKFGGQMYPLNGANNEVSEKYNYVVHQKTLHLLYEKLNDGNRIMIIDECHNVPENMRKAINLWKGFVYGVTASPFRGEFKEEGFKMLFGLFHETGAEALPVKVTGLQKDRIYSMKDMMIASEGLAPDSFEMYRKLLYNDTERNNDIVKLALACHKKHKRVIVFVDRVELAETLFDMLPNKDKYLLIGKTSNQDLAKSLENEDSFIIVGSRGCVSEGLDIPHLMVGILTFNTSNLKTLQQMTGRVCRKYKDKTHGYFVDMMDIIKVAGTRPYYGGISSRKKIYNKLKYPFTIKKI